MPRIIEQNRLALVIAYYLSKFDDFAYRRLGLGGMSQTHKVIGQILNVKQNTIKNMRDEFDPLHDNARKGWHQRDITGSRLKIVEKYSAYTEDKLFRQVQNILYPNKRSQIFFDEIDSEEISGSDRELIEGELIEKKVMLYKRNQKGVSLCKERDHYTCQGCGFYYEKSIVECHHIKPISMTKETILDIDNLLTLCPTCHRLAHSLLRIDYERYTEKKLLVKTLKKIIKKANGS